MKFVRVTQLLDGVEALQSRLVRELSDAKQVLWLVPGGSNIPLSAAVMLQLPEDLTTNLTIMLTDERYGDFGHPDSNTRQLDEAGFTPKRATVLPVLYAGLSYDETVRRYGQNFQEQVKVADIVIAQFGMGSDGHIAGILPGSPAVSSADFAAGYKSPTFTRITLTPKALQQVTVAFLYAFGDGKLEALQNLQSKTLSLDEQPAQILKQLPDAYVYNDQIGDLA